MKPLPIGRIMLAIALAVSPLYGQTIPLAYVEVDAGMAGDCKMAGDIDGDGLPDLVIGGMPGEKLNWYRAPSWAKTVIAVPAVEFTTDGALADVDADSDLDIVVPDGDGADNLLWFENPRPGGDPADGALWQRRVIGSVGGWGKDVKPADYDRDGRLDVATRSSGQAMIFFRTAAGAWLKVGLAVASLGSEGLGQDDLDKDGDMDLIVCGAWLENPGGAAARTPASWQEHEIGPADGTFKALAIDLDGDGARDVVYSSSEGTADVRWWRPVSGDPAGEWTGSTILSSMSGVHTLQGADMDLDGDQDIVLAQMHTTTDRKVLILFNADGLGTSWQAQEVAASGLHNGVVADIANDGDSDIYGANWTGNPPLKLWLSGQSAPAEPSLTLLAPNGWERWNLGETRTIAWNAVNYTGTVRLVLFKGGTRFGNIATGIPAADGSYTWTVGQTYDSGMAPEGADYRLFLRSQDNTLVDPSDYRLALTEPAQLEVTAPNGSESWQLGTTRNITWNANGYAGTVRLILFRKGGKIGQIATGMPAAQGTFAWTVGSHANGTAAAGDLYSIRLLAGDGSQEDYSDAPFELTD